LWVTLNLREFKLGSIVKGLYQEEILSVPHGRFSALCSAPHKADYVDRSIMWTIGGGMFRTPSAAWLFGD